MWRVISHPSELWSSVWDFDLVALKSEFLTFFMRRRTPAYRFCFIFSVQHSTWSSPRTWCPTQPSATGCWIYSLSWGWWGERYLQCYLREHRQPPRPTNSSSFCHDCCPSFNTNHILKYANDTTVVGVIWGNNEVVYGENVEHLLNKSFWTFGDPDSGTRMQTQPLHQRHGCGTK